MITFEAEIRGFIESGRRFLKSAGLLMSGSALSQVFLLVSMPLIGRMFTPEQIGVLGTYIAFFCILTPLCTLRFEQAILLPKSDTEAKALFTMALMFPLAFTLALMPLFLLLGDQYIAPAFGLSVGSYFWFLLPISVVMQGIMQIGGVWFIRYGRYQHLAASRLLLSGGLPVFQLGAGFMAFGALGLLVGQLLAQIISVFSILFNVKRTDGYILSMVSLKAFKHHIVRHKNFPLLSLPAGLISTLAEYIPYFILGVFFGPATVGIYTIAQKSLNAPTALVSNAVQEVFREKASYSIRNQGHCRPLFIKTLLLLSIIVIPVSVLLIWKAPVIFAWFFGSDWRHAGEYAVLLTPLFCMRFICIPLANILFIAEKQSTDLKFQLCLFLVSLGSLLIGALKGSPEWSIGLFSICSAFMYFIYLILSYKYTIKVTNEPVASWS